MEAGCKKKEWEIKNGIPYRYHWVGQGDLLETGICIGSDYKKNFAPAKEEPKVYNTIDYQRVRDVDPKAQTLSIDFTLVMRWIDPRIKANFSAEDRERGGVLISSEAVQKLWTPDFQVWNRTSLKPKRWWASMISSKIVENTDINALDGKNRTPYELTYPTVEMRYEIKTTVYCTFNYANYPMDNQTCDVGLGSASFESTFALYDKQGVYHTQQHYQTGNLNISIEFFDGNRKDGKNIVGIRVHMSRMTYSFFMQYYVPCAIIVAVSVVGFAVPIKEIAGRVDLLVTQLLTLISLFIHSMVSLKNIQGTVSFIVFLQSYLQTPTNLTFFIFICAVGKPIYIRT